MDTENHGIIVDVWSDVMCPFCYLGDAFLGQALERFEHGEDVEIRYHSFLLMPDLPVGSRTDLTTLLVQERDFPREQAEAMNAQFAQRGRPAGLDYRMDRAIATNTRAAHELSHFAARHGLQHQMLQRLFKAYFTDGLFVGDHQVLADLAQEIGLDRAEALTAVDSGDFARDVDADLEQARQLGITGVPFFVFGGKYAVSGAQPPEAFLRALETTRQETAGQPAGTPR